MADLDNARLAGGKLPLSFDHQALYVPELI